MEQTTEATVEPRVDDHGGTLDYRRVVPARVADWRWRPVGPALPLDRFRLAILAYLGTRALLVVVAVVDGAVRHHSLWSEAANWDGGWYRALATDGYKHEVLHSQTTTGFFPLYPLVTWLLSQPLLIAMHSEVNAAILAGVVVSMVGGLVATVLVQHLAAGWWGEAAGRRAAVLFCLFPGSVVFSMVYAEGIMIPLAAGCILALQRRRWLLAGLLAGAATASEPEAAVLIAVCAVSAAVALGRRGWRNRDARRALVAPLLAPTGLVAVIAFLWAWTGTPRAYWIAQHDAWNERMDPLSLPHLAIRLAGQIHLSHFNRPTINLNWPVGLIGAALLVVLLVMLIRMRDQISIEAWVWTLGISFITFTSEWVPPNPRLLITAFPAVIALAYRPGRKRFYLLAAINAILLASMSAVTFVGFTLRP